MPWTITVRPTTAELHEWSWSAVRDDQESVMRMGGYDSAQEALEDARADVLLFESNLRKIAEATLTEVFTPEVPA